MTVDAPAFRRPRASLAPTAICLLVAALFAAGSPPLLAGDQPDSAVFTVALAPGISLGYSPQALHFSSYAVGLAFEYGPVVNLDGAAIRISLESGYGQQIGQYDGSVGIYQQVLSPSYTSMIRRVPVMFWVSVESRANITPYIRSGAGVSWTKYSENYADSTGRSFEASDWGFTWGIGGGIRYRMNPTLSIAIFLDDWVSVDDVGGEVHSMFGTYNRGVKGPVKMTMVGIRGTMRIF